MTASERPTAATLRIVRERYGVTGIMSGPRDQPYDFTEEEKMRGLIRELLDEIDILKSERSGYTSDEIEAAIEDLQNADVASEAIVAGALVGALRFAARGRIAAAEQEVGK